MDNFFVSSTIVDTRYMRAIHGRPLQSVIVPKKLKVKTMQLIPQIKQQYQNADGRIKL